MYWKTSRRAFAHLARAFLEVLNYWIVLFPSTGSHKHPNHFLGELDRSWRSLGGIKHGIFLYSTTLPYAWKVKGWNPREARQLSIGLLFLAEPGERENSWLQTNAPINNNQAFFNTSSDNNNMSVRNQAHTGKHGDVSTATACERVPVRLTLFGCPLVPIYIYLSVSCNLLQGAQHFICQLESGFYWWTIDLPSMPACPPALHPHPREIFGHNQSRS